MMTLTYHNLPRLGINPLTGEACAFGMRMLCDLSQSGTELMRDFMGLTGDSEFPKNWNSYVGSAPAIHSVMIERSAFESLMRFALFRAGHQYVIGRPGSLDMTGFGEEDMEKNPGLREYLNPNCFLYQGEHPQFLHRNPKHRAKQPSEGSRNVHAFTGRVD